MSSPDSPQPGTLLIANERLLAACGGTTLLELLEVQMEGRKRLPARDFLNGARVTSGEKLGV